MKKVLLTSTALVAFAGAAAAEVTISGWAEMGVIGGQDITTQFYNDVDVDFNMTGESDGGLVFGAVVDLDSAGDLSNETSKIGDFEVFVSGEWGTVTMGDIDGALDWAADSVATWGDPGTIDDSETAHFGFQDTFLDGSYDGQVFRYDYAFNDFAFAVSFEQDDRSDHDLRVLDEDRDDYDWAIGAKWSPVVGPGTVKLGVGYQQADDAKVTFEIPGAVGDELNDIYEEAQDNGDNATIALLEAISDVDDDNTDDTYNLKFDLGDDTSVWALSAGYVIDSGMLEGLQFGGVYSDWEGDDFDDGYYWGLGIGYAWEAFSIHANYGENKFEFNGPGDIKLRGAGLAAGYDLGGGLSVLGGYGWSKFKIDGTHTDADGNEDTSTWSLGLSMAF